MARRSELAHGNMPQEFVDRGMHHFGKGKRVQTHRKHTYRKNAQKGELARIDVVELGNLLVRDLAEDDTFVHPQRICRTEDQ